MSQRGSWLAAGVCAVLLLAAAILAFAPGSNSSSVELVERGPSESPKSEPSPFATLGQSPEDEASGLDAADIAATPLQTGLPARPADEEPVAQLQEQLPPVDVREIAQQPLTDDEFESLVERLRSDPALLAALIDESRSQVDPERLTWLLRLLGDVDDPAVVALATEFVYSGDPAQRRLGLDLMKRVRPGDPDVLASVSDLLSTEVDGQVLVPALTALARPGDVDDSTRASLVSQVAILADHADPSVRRGSLTILSRWSNDSSYTPQLLAGLDDVDESVRKAAAFAFVGHEDASAHVRYRLMTTADDNLRSEATRRGAILALKRMPLEPDERARVMAIERALDSRPIR